MKKFKPKTQPTGFPADASKVVKKKAAFSGPPVSVVRAWLVKVCYTQERGRWESFKSGKLVIYKPPRSYDGRSAVTLDGEVEIEIAKSSVWQRIVDWCDARKIQPEEYVRSAFVDLEMLLAAPEPNQLMSQRYMAKWEKISDGMVERLRVSLISQKSIARRHIIVNQSFHGDTPEFAQRLVLTDSSLDLSPLFRYCLAVSIGTKPMRKIARKFQAEAVLQFECHRTLYKTVWASVLPEGFSAMSKRLYPLVLAKLGYGMKPSEPSDEY
jgi:hypothetical protein